MWMFVGLGNPGNSYARNRHNVGFMVLDALAQHCGAADKFRKKFQGLSAEISLTGQKILLLKPQTYMNLSGQAVQDAAHFYKIDPAHIIVFHDEIDIDPQDVRVKQGGGNAGHNGLKSIQSSLGTPDFWRVRIGIGRGHPDGDVSNFVLGDFGQQEWTDLEPLLLFMATHATDILRDGPKAYEKTIQTHLKDKTAGV